MKARANFPWSKNLIPSIGKNPLEIPPGFGSLPEPNKKNDKSNKAKAIEDDIEKLFKDNNFNKNSESKDKSAEDFVLKQIKKN